MKRAQGHLLEFLYSYVTNLGGAEAENLLDEDPAIMQRRAAAKQVHACAHQPGIQLIVSLSLVCIACPAQLNCHQRDSVCAAGARIVSICTF